MQVFHVYIDDLRFTFVDRQRVEELKQRVVEASRADGGFITITHSSRPPSEIFVTDNTRVRIETSTISPEQPPGRATDEPPDGEEDTFWFDFDAPL